MDSPPNRLCARCGHHRGDHLPTRDAPDGASYPGQCNFCSCGYFVHPEWASPKKIVVIGPGEPMSPEMIEALKDVAAEVRYINSSRKHMTEFRVTFGWSQPHGPHAADGDIPSDPNGHYSTIFAFDEEHAKSMTQTRYGPKWSRIYLPHQWKAWGPEMIGCEELEKLQFHPNFDLTRWPDLDHFHAGIVLGRPK